MGSWRWSRTVLLWWGASGFLVNPGGLSRSRGAVVKGGLETGRARGRVVARPSAESKTDAWRAASESTWRSRREATRKVFEMKLAFEEAETEAKQSELEAAAAKGLDAPAPDVESAVASTAIVVAVLAVVLRLGGRAALLGMLGVDAGADAAVKETIDGFVATARGFGGEAGLFAVYLSAFVVAKTLCLDAFTFALALSSGVLFGGVVQGTLVATTCATLGSSVAFGIARYGRPTFRSKLLRLVRRDPKLRALEDSVTDNGFQTVLVLRLAPVLPIPIAAYNYLYGATEIEYATAFAPAMFLGSIKPYAFDAYLGVFGKSLVDAAAEEGAAASHTFVQDLPILAVFAVFIAVGSLASELATKTWAAMEAANADDRPDDPGAPIDDEDWVDVLELRETPPWKLAAAASTAAAEREPESFKIIRKRAKRARYALANMATEELDAARRDRVLGSDAVEDLPPTATERPDGHAPPTIPKGGDESLDVPSSLIESTLYAWVIFRALLDEKSLAEEIASY